MLLTIDTGNTETVLGLFNGNELCFNWRVSSLKTRSVDELFILFSALFCAGGVKTTDIEGAVICSVVPPLGERTKEALSRFLGEEVFLVGDNISASMPIITDNPAEVGADRIVNAIAAYEKFKGSAIIVDLGTAITVDLVTENGEYAGGAIAPGIGISMEALFTKTAVLPRVELKRPARFLGKNTRDAMQSGIFFGFSALIDGIIKGIINELGHRPAVVATGGLSGAFKGGSEFIELVDEFLTLKGLNILYERR